MIDGRGAAVDHCLRSRTEPDASQRRAVWRAQLESGRDAAGGGSHPQVMHLLCFSTHIIFFLVNIYELDGILIF